MNNIKKWIKYPLWVAVIVSTIMIYSANHFYPKGPMFDTGDVVCQNDDRGPCAEKFIEDPRFLNVPDWVKFFKKSEGELLWFALLFVAFVASFQGEDK